MIMILGTRWIFQTTFFSFWRTAYDGAQWTQIFIDNSTNMSEVAHLDLTNSSLELLPNDDTSYFMLNGNMINYRIDLLDVSENVVHNINNTSVERIIEDSSLGQDGYFLRVEHLTNAKLFFQTILK